VYLLIFLVSFYLVALLLLFWYLLVAREIVNMTEEVQSDEVFKKLDALKDIR